MGIRHLPPCWYAIGTTWQCNLVIVSYNPFGTICPICRQYIGRIYTYAYGSPAPPTLPMHEHCYCWYERTSEGLTLPPTIKPPPPPEVPDRIIPIEQPIITIPIDPEPLRPSPIRPVPVPTPIIVPEPIELFPPDPRYPPPGGIPPDIKR